LKKMYWLAAAVAVVLGISIGLLTPVSDHAAARAAGQVVSVDDAWRAALPRDPEQATQAYMGRLSSAARSRSDAYFEGRYRIGLVSVAIGVLVTWIILASRVLVRMRDAVERRVRNKWLPAFAVAATMILVSSAWSLPFDVYAGFFREHAYGLSNQAFGEWFREHLIGTGISMVAMGLFLSLLNVVLRRAPRTWWIWGAGLGIVFLVGELLIAPVYIDPLFNTYKPLTDARVKDPILSMARANGVPADNVYQFDASKQSNRVSANVTGIFGTAAVRLNDNLLNRTSLPEIKAVMGHELGHYVLNHVYKHLLVFGMLLVVGFAVLKWTFAAAVDRWGARFGIRDQADPVALAILVALFSVLALAGTPLRNTEIRVAEEEADIFGLNASQEADGFAEVNLKLIEYRKANPGPIEEFVFFDHPSPRKRIYAAMRWKAEHWKN
jgi:STE24 endopeptidase